MNRWITSWHSPALNKEMPVVVYGHYGFALLLIPTASADYLEYERFGLLEVLRPYIEAGKVKIFSINSINTESWMNDGVEPRQKIVRHKEWNRYVYEEVLPFIRQHTSDQTSVISSGASFGALHSANLFFQRPDLLQGCIAMSGVYELTEYTKGYFDEDVYFNSPMHYLPQLTDPAILDQIRQSRHIHLLSGTGAYEDPESARRLAGILYEKGISYELSIWGPEWKHDWPTWLAMLPAFLELRF